MSKKNKVLSGKSGKKTVVKKTAGKEAKPSDKKIAPKKAPIKKIIVAKKSVKKVIKAASKPKPIVKKSVSAKKIVKTTNSKKITKPITKVATKKPIKASSQRGQAKPIIKSKAQVSKVVAPKVVAKKINLKPEKFSKPISKPLKEEIKKISPAALEKAKKAEEVLTKKANLEKKANEVMAITNNIPIVSKAELSPTKIASISNSITNPIKKTDSYAVRPEKEPQGKFEMEFVVHSSADMLYEFLSSASGLSEWFCDDLNIRNGIYTFIWEDQMQQARLLKTVDLTLVRFQWVDKTDGSYFEFRIQRDDLTNDISLIITDFADTNSERESSKLLWNSQIEKLMHVIGSIF